ncbi:MAG: hypothetical protein ACSHXK_06215 [Oceanococcus sp.]
MRKNFSISRNTLVLAALLFWPLTSPASDLGRLQSIKQQALALYTLRLADQRQFSPSATVLIGQRGQDLSLRRVRIAIDGHWKIDYRYRSDESALLAQGAMHKMGLVDLASGAHGITVEAYWQAAGDEPGQWRKATYGQTMRLDAWPRGFSINLVPNRERGDASLDLTSPVDGGGILRSAQFEITQGHALKALAQLQTLAHIDPALSSTPLARELLARSLQAWGLGNAAQAIYSALADSPDTDEDRKIRAELAAATLALKGHSSAQNSKRLSQERTLQWPASQKLHAQMLETQRLIQAGDIEQALKIMPSGGSAVQRYNLAAALIQQQRSAPAEDILRNLAVSAPSRDEFIARIQDLSRIKLAYRHLARGEAGQAEALMGRVRLDSVYINRALLGRGWSKLLPLAVSNNRLQPIQDDGFRPGFVQAIDAALRDPSINSAANIRTALQDWARLQDQDPMDPAVQEAQVATAYALLKLGDYSRAIQYSEKAIGRLEAVRDNLKLGMRASRKGQAINGIALVRDQWPPAPSAWARQFVVGAWWDNEDEKLEAPDGAYRARLIAQPDSVRILQAMHMLNQVEQLMDAVVEHPDLAARATQLRKQIEAERVAQQKALDRHVYYWMRQELERATRYLIMARFSLGHAYAHDKPTSLPNSNAATGAEK